MNEEDGYGTREACQKLIEAGIEVETDSYWCDNLGWVTLRSGDDVPVESCDWKIYPALSMFEAWRELPKGQSYSISSIYEFDDRGWKVIVTMNGHSFKNVNPTDALIDLLIWLKGSSKTSED